MGKKQQGFTLMELLIVIAIIIVLAAAVFVALNPAKRFQDARDATRASDIGNVVSALKTSQVDDGGAYIAAVAALTADTAYQIGTDAAACDAGCTAEATEAACADLTELETDGYLGSIPFDPSTGALTKSDYYIMRNTSGTVTVGACDPEGADPIVVTQ